MKLFLHYFYVYCILCRAFAKIEALKKSQYSNLERNETKSRSNWFHSEFTSKRKPFINWMYFSYYFWHTIILFIYSKKKSLQNFVHIKNSVWIYFCVLFNFLFHFFNDLFISQQTAVGAYWCQQLSVTNDLRTFHW